MTPFYDNEKPENTDSTYVGWCTRWIPFIEPHYRFLKFRNQMKA